MMLRWRHHDVNTKVGCSGVGEREPASFCDSGDPASHVFRATIACSSQVNFDSVPNCVRKVNSTRRSGCPVSISLERFGDRWSLLIIRDLMVRGFRTFMEFEASGEGIATNILTDRLCKLETWGIIAAEEEAADRRRVNCRLTEKGIDLAPVVLELLIWGVRHEQTGAPVLSSGRWRKIENRCSLKFGGGGENETQLRCYRPLRTAAMVAKGHEPAREP